MEERILREAVEAIESWPEAHRRRRAYVVAGAGWHEGVIGIVASRLVERYNRPVVLIAGTEGDWKGSGRSIPGFDLHDGLRQCAGHLERWGGHAAAAGLSIKPERVEAFAEAFSSIGDLSLGEEDLRPPAKVDALVHGRDLTLDLCAELASLAPFGLGNPGITLLLAGCELAELGPVGDGKHLRFRVREDGRDSGSAIAFRFGGQIDRLRRVGHYDVAFRLEANQWNGTVSPQLNVREIFDGDDRYLERREWLKTEWRKPAEARDPDARAVFEELGLREGGEGAPARVGAVPRAPGPSRARARRLGHTATGADRRKLDAPRAPRAHLARRVVQRNQHPGHFRGLAFVAALAHDRLSSARKTSLLRGEYRRSVTRKPGSTIFL